MKSILVLTPMAIALSLTCIACSNPKQTIPDEETPVAVMLGEETVIELQEGTYPQMEVSITNESPDGISDGFAFILTAGDQIEGHYDQEEQYWVCSENEQAFETSSDIYGDKEYTTLRIKGGDGIGLVDSKGKVVVLPMYRSIQLGFTNGLCPVQDENDRYGLIAEDGKIVLLPKYDYIWTKDIKDDIIMVSKDGLVGFVNMQGEVVIPLKYEGLEQAGDGMIWFIQEAQQWGCINYKDEVVVQAEFTHTAPFINGKAKAQKEDGVDYFIYTDGKVEKAQ